MTANATPRRLRRPALRRLLASLLFGAAIGGAVVTPAAAVVPTLSIPWGVVSDDDLRSRSCPSDSNAEAIVLADIGRFEFTHDDYSAFRHTRRVKILKASAYDKWGTVGIAYQSSHGAQSVENLRAHTLTQNADGTTKSVDLPAKDVFDEKINRGFRQKKFTFPGLTPGCIIEYEYELRSAYPSMPDWQFQMSEPVYQSAYSVTVPSNSRLLLWRRGEQSGLTETKLDHPWPTTMWDTDKAARYGLKLVEFRWTAANMPALRAEPYLTTLDNYLTSLQVIFDGFEWSDGLPQDHTDTWEKEAKWLSDYEWFGGAIRLGPAGKERVKSLVQARPDTASRVQAIYDYVRTAIRCNSVEGIYSSPAQEVFDAHSGSGAEVNLLFIAMLRQAGVTAWPALISTRDNGEPYMGYPLIRQFNYVVTAVERKGGYDLLDPTNPLRPAGLLPPRALAQYAWVVRDVEPEWYPIPPDQSTSIVRQVSARLDPQGRVAGRVTGFDTGYSALDERTAWRDVSADSTRSREHLVNTLFPDYAAATIVNYNVTGGDSLEEPLGFDLRFAELDAAVPAGRTLALKPFFMAGHARNPFVHATRHYPVDLPHSINEHYRLKLELPAGWTCPTLPPDVAEALPGGGGLLTRHYEWEDGRLVYERNLLVKQLRFEVRDYARLRDFFDRVAETAGEELLLGEASAPKAAADGVRK